MAENTTSSASRAARSGQFKILISADDTGSYVTIEFLEGQTAGKEVRLKPIDRIPFQCLMVATEHLMRLAAHESSAGFDRALELLVEGARTNQTLDHPKRMTY